MIYVWGCIFALGVYCVWDTSRGMTRWEWCATLIMLAILAAIIALVAVLA